MPENPIEGLALSRVGDSFVMFPSIAITPDLEAKFGALFDAIEADLTGANPGHPDLKDGRTQIVLSAVVQMVVGRMAAEARAGTVEHPGQDLASAFGTGVADMFDGLDPDLVWHFWGRAGYATMAALRTIEAARQSPGPGQGN